MSGHGTCIILLLLITLIIVKPDLVACICNHNTQEEERMPQVKGYQYYIGLSRKQSKSKKYLCLIKHKGRRKER